MPVGKYGVTMLFAGVGIALVTATAPFAAADDTCDPSVTVCEGGDLQSGPAVSDAPVMPTGGDQYPFDSDWYFNPAGGGTALQPVHPSDTGGGAVSGGVGRR